MTSLMTSDCLRHQVTKLEKEAANLALQLERCG
jgi:hypothetical protein